MTTLTKHEQLDQAFATFEDNYNKINVHSCASGSRCKRGNPKFTDDTSVQCGCQGACTGRSRASARAKADTHLYCTECIDAKMHFSREQIGFCYACVEVDKRKDPNQVLMDGPYVDQVAKMADGITKVAAAFEKARDDKQIDEMAENHVESVATRLLKAQQSRAKKLLVDDPELARELAFIQEMEEGEERDERMESLMAEAMRQADRARDAANGAFQRRVADDMGTSPGSMPPPQPQPQPQPRAPPVVQPPPQQNAGAGVTAANGTPAGEGESAPASPVRAAAGPRAQAKPRKPDSELTAAQLQRRVSARHLAENNEFKRINFATAMAEAHQLGENANIFQARAEKAKERVKEMRKIAMEETAKYLPVEAVDALFTKIDMAFDKFKETQVEPTFPPMSEALSHLALPHPEAKKRKCEVDPADDDLIEVADGASKFPEKKRQRGESSSAAKPKEPKEPKEPKQRKSSAGSSSASATSPSRWGGWFHF